MVTQRTAVSVVIPVLNTERYLAECMDSVLTQTLQEIEVLCIDDGSTDGSLEVLEEYAKKDSRVRILRHDKTERGPGAARNLGISQASGEYIACVDSDDYIHPDMLSRMYEEAMLDDVDVVMCLLQKFSDKDRRERYAKCTYDRFIGQHLDGHSFDWRSLDDMFMLRFASCNKIYKRSFLDEHAIRYAEGIFYEDMTFTYQALAQARKLRLVRRYFYFNRKEREDATTFIQSDRVFDVLNAMDRVDTFLASDPAYEPLNENFAVFRFVTMTNYLHQNDADHMPRYYDTLKELALDPALVNHPRMTDELVAKRDRIIRNDLLGYLVWEIWALNHRYSESRRQAARIKAQYQGLRARTERSVFCRAEFAVRGLLRPAVHRVRRLLRSKKSKTSL